VVELRLKRSGAVPPVPDDAQVWRDWSGVPRAYGYTLDGDHWIRLPDVGSFRFTVAGEWVEAWVPKPISRGEVEEVFRRHVLRFVLQARGRELLHASAVAMPGGAVAFCGSSGVGKSTVAYGFSRRGHSPIADDALLFESAGGRVHILPLPFRLHLSGESALNRHGPKAPLDLDPEGVEGSPGGAALPLAALFVLEPSAEVDPAMPEIVSLRNASAFPVLLYHAHCFSFRDERRLRLMADRYLQLAASVPTLRLRYRRDIERLPNLLDAVERELG
jgi:hypothetical protein